MGVWHNEDSILAIRQKEQEEQAKRDAEDKLLMAYAAFISGAMDGRIEQPYPTEL